MEDEHCHRKDSDEQFETLNYAITTTPRKEWTIIQDNAPNADTKGKKTTNVEEPITKGRKIPNIKELMKIETTTRANLRDCEITAVVMYTGPMVCINWRITHRSD